MASPLSKTSDMLELETNERSDGGIASSMELVPRRIINH